MKGLRQCLPSAFISPSLCFIQDRLLPSVLCLHFTCSNLPFQEASSQKGSLEGAEEMAMIARVKPYKSNVTPPPENPNSHYKFEDVTDDPKVKEGPLGVPSPFYSNFMIPVSRTKTSWFGRKFGWILSDWQKQTKAPSSHNGGKDGGECEVTCPGKLTFMMIVILIYQL